ncbi:ParA family protein [Paenibacillus sp. FSL K6-0276]|uniref:ParA family protein n=1 Tax=Paenibacillus sp. FSL K6-0276 TaxID=2921450 RepID=UPI0030EB8D28
MKVITFFNNKGGVGKTTLGVNIAAYFSLQMKKRVLVIDVDPQANTTQMIIPEDEWDLLYSEDKKEIKTLHDYLTPLVQGTPEINTALLKPATGDKNRFGVDLIPGDPNISIVEDILSDAWNKSISGSIEGFRKTNWLNSILNHFEDTYDIAFIDVGPSLGALNRSVLLNSDYIVTPMGSDIFSLMAVKNISKWIRGWKEDYSNGVTLMQRRGTPYEEFNINLNVEKVSSLIGYSVQQYVTKSFKNGRRPIKSYDAIIKEIPSIIENNLQELIPDKLDIDKLNLGDVPYLYSLVPLAQSSNTPIFGLKAADGISGLQYGHVVSYEEALKGICEKISANMGDLL